MNLACFIQQQQQHADLMVVAKCWLVSQSTSRRNSACLTSREPTTEHDDLSRECNPFGATFTTRPVVCMCLLVVVAILSRV